MLMVDDVEERVGGSSLDVDVICEWSQSGRSSRLVLFLVLNSVLTFRNELNTKSEFGFVFGTRPSADSGTDYNQ